MTSQPIKTALIAGDRTLNHSPQRLGRLTASPPDTSSAALASAYAQQGYLWVKGLIPSETIWNFRRRYFEAFAAIGMIAPDTDPKIGIAAQHYTVTRRARELDNQIVLWDEYADLCTHPALVRLFEKLLGSKVHLLQRKMIRRMTPGSEWSTPAHYDLTYIRGGTDRSLRTAWIPLGDIPVQMGGLVYLEGSDRAGRKLEAEFTRKNANLSPEERISAFNRNMREGGWLTDNLPELADRLDSRWLAADYEAGDVVIHSPYMIHAATTNQDTTGRIRLSTDIRYQLTSEPIDERWSNDWHHDDNL